MKDGARKTAKTDFLEGVPLKKIRKNLKRGRIGEKNFPMVPIMKRKKLRIFPSDLRNLSLLIQKRETERRP